MRIKKFWSKICIILLGVLIAFQTSCGSSSQKCTVTFIGADVNPIEVNVGDTIKLPEPILAGSSFSGWFTDSIFTDRFYESTPIVNDLSLYAKWVSGDNVLYTVFFLVDEVVVEQKTLEEGGTLLHDDFPILQQRDGYVGYWDVEGDIQGINTNIYVHGVYLSLANSVTLSFDSLGGSIINDQVLAINTCPQRPSDPSYLGFQDKYFVDWYTSKDYSKKFNFSEPLVSNTTVYAGWTSEKPTYQDGTVVEYTIPHIVGDFNGWNYDDNSITFSTIGARAGANIYPLVNTNIILVYSKIYKTNINDWTYLSAINLEGNEVTSSADFSTLAGHDDFSTYYTIAVHLTNKSVDVYERSGNSSKVIDPGSGLVSVPNVYCVRFNTLGGSNISKQYIGEGKKPILFTDIEKTGYTFGGWYKESSCVNEFTSSNTVSSNITLYAKWASGYVITFVSEGGSEVASQTLPASGGLVIRPNDPTKENYSFSNWYVDSSFRNVFDFTQVISCDLTLYAKWILKTSGLNITVSFSTQGGSPSSASQSLKSGIIPEIPLYCPRISGKYFTGWYRDNTCNVKFDFIEGFYEDTILYAGYSDIPSGSYAIYYDFSTRFPEIAIVGNSVRQYGITADTCQRSGYNFLGWYLDSNYATRATDWPKTTSGNVVTLYAKWEDSTTFTFNYYDGSSIIHTEQRKINQSISPSDLYTPEDKYGYFFNGWYLDKDLTQKFPDSYTVTKNLDLFASFVTDTPKKVSFYHGETLLTTKNILKQELTYDSLASYYTPAEDGYVFIGWYFDKDLTNCLPPSYLLESDISLYGGFVESTANCEGTGTQTDPYIATSFNQLLVSLNSPSKNTTSTYYKLSNDVDANNNVSLPRLYAQIDCGYHKISNVTRSLFYRVENNASFDNAHLDVDIKTCNKENDYGSVTSYCYGNINSIYVTGTIYLANTSYVGGVAGVVQGSSGYGIIKNCQNDANLYAKDYVGGIAGLVSQYGGKLIFSVNNGITSALSGTYDSYLKVVSKHGSGVAGYSHGNILLGCGTTTSGDYPSGKPILGYSPGGVVLSYQSIIFSTIDDFLLNWLNYDIDNSKPTYLAGVDGTTVYRADREDPNHKYWTNNVGVWKNVNGVPRLVAYI